MLLIYGVRYRSLMPPLIHEPMPTICLAALHSMPLAAMANHAHRQRRKKPHGSATHRVFRQAPVYRWSIPKASGSDPALPGLLCLRDLWNAKDKNSAATTAGVNATDAALPRKKLPVLVIHGVDDGLIPEAFGSAPYVAWAEKNNRDMHHWRVGNAQHFDGFLGLPVLGMRYVPLMPYAYHGLDAMWAHVSEKKSLPDDALIKNTPRKFEAGVLAPLQKENLGEMPRLNPAAPEFITR